MGNIRNHNFAIDSQPPYVVTEEQLKNPICWLSGAVDGE